MLLLNIDFPAKGLGFYFPKILGIEAVLKACWPKNEKILLASYFFGIEKGLGFYSGLITF